MAAASESSCLSDRLNATIYFLVEQSNCPVDELLLEKLLAHVSVLVQREKDALLNLDLNRIVKCLISPRKDSQILSFGLNLVGIVGSTKINAESDVIKSLVVFWLKRVKNPNCSAIIRSCGLEMLTKLIANNNLKEVLVETEILEVAVSLLSDNSLFVCMEAQIFLKEFLLTSLAENGDFSRKTKDDAVKTMQIILVSSCYNSKRLFTSCISLCKRMLEDARLTDIQQQKIQSHFLDTLLKSKDKFVNEKICEVLVLTSFQDCENSIYNILKHLTELGFIEIALKFCRDVLSKPLSVDATKKLETYISNVIEPNLQTTNNLTSVLAGILIQLDFSKLSVTFNEKFLHWLCDFLKEPNHYPPKLTISILEGIYTIFPFVINNVPLCSNAVKSINEIITLRSSSNAIIIKALNVLSRIIINFAPKIGVELILHDISNSLSHLLFHPSWEIQDSVLEFIGKVIATIADSLHLQQHILSNQLHSSVIEKLFLSDESFVRASSLFTLAELSKIDSFWESILQTHTEDKIINQVLRLLNEDTEAVVRRAAASVINDWYRNKHFSLSWQEQFRVSMQNATNDLDWEVKLCALDFWKKILVDVERRLEETSTSNNVENLFILIDELDKSGFCKSVFSCIDDCDSSVKLESAIILKSLKQRVTNSHLIIEDSQVKLSPEDVNMAAEDSNPPVPMDDKIMEEVLNTLDCDSVTQTLDDLKMITNETDVPVKKSVATMGRHEFLASLLRLDLDAAITEAESNSDMYEDNFELLINDIIAKREENNVIIDCY